MLCTYSQRRCQISQMIKTKSKNESQSTEGGTFFFILSCFFFKYNVKSKPNLCTYRWSWYSSPWDSSHGITPTRDSSLTGFLPHRIAPKGLLPYRIPPTRDSSHRIPLTQDSSHTGFGYTLAWALFFSSYNYF